MRKAGGEVCFRVLPGIRHYSGRIVGDTGDDITLETCNDSVPDLSRGRCIVITEARGNCYAKVVGREHNTLTLERLWDEKRESFRVDDVVPFVYTRIESDRPLRRSRLLSAWFPGVPDIPGPDETVNPALLKMLTAIDTKLNLILERLHLDDEGLLRAENRRVNMSASGMRFVVDEKPAVGDILEVKMLLSRAEAVLVYGTVVRVSEAPAGDWSVALSFVNMTDEVQDRIVYHVLNRQREMTKKQSDWSTSEA